jgi:hypothetical protein
MRNWLLAMLMSGCAFDSAGLDVFEEKNGTADPGSVWAQPVDPDLRADWEECTAAAECDSGACIDLGQDFGSVCGEACDSSGPGSEDEQPCPFNLSCIDGYCQPAPIDDPDGPKGPGGPGGG